MKHTYIDPSVISTQSGVYLFKNNTHDIIYIGKAKNLRNRVSSYFANKDNDKVQQLIAEATDLETIITKTETEALFLEAQLIKKHQPKYNVLLKSGQPFVFILFSDEKIPTISVVRNKKKKGTYFGPFLTKNQAYGVCRYLISTFQLKLCTKKIEQGCLEYHIHICAGNCKPDFDIDYYLLRLKVAQNLLKNETSLAIQLLESEIKKASQELNFERAKHLHSYLQSLESIITTMKTIKRSPIAHILTNDIETKSNIPLLSKLKNKLKLKHIPYTIDCFDISHLQGTNIVGSCIRFTNGKPDAKNFRRFQIKTLTDQNDYAALAEIVQRRYRHTINIPDLVIIDGGIGQVNAVKDFISGADVVGLAKREETIIKADTKETIKLNEKNEEDRLIIAIRDYAHHFAISYQRKKRSFT